MSDPKRCTCGSKSVNGGGHSSWCDSIAKMTEQDVYDEYSAFYENLRVEVESFLQARDDEDDSN